MCVSVVSYCDPRKVLPHLLLTLLVYTYWFVRSVCVGGGREGFKIVSPFSFVQRSHRPLPCVWCGLFFCSPCSRRYRGRREQPSRRHRPHPVLPVGQHRPGRLRGGGGCRHRGQDQRRKSALHQANGLQRRVLLRWTHHRHRQQVLSLLPFAICSSMAMMAAVVLPRRQDLLLMMLRQQQREEEQAGAVVVVVAANHHHGLRRRCRCRHLPRR